MPNICRNDTEVLAQYSLCKQCIEVFVRRHEPSGDIFYAREIEWESYPDYKVPKPVLELIDVNAQQLMDDLWRCGLRPTEGRGSAGALAATQEHLKDMRMIVSKQLGVQL